MRNLHPKKSKTKKTYTFYEEGECRQNELQQQSSDSTVVADDNENWIAKNIAKLHNYLLHIVNTQYGLLPTLVRAGVLTREQAEIIRTLLSQVAQRYREDVLWKARNIYLLIVVEYITLNGIRPNTEESRRDNSPLFYSRERHVLDKNYK